MYRLTPTDKRNITLAEKASERGDGETALKYYLKAAENGNVSAMIDCACIYFEGRKGVEKNVDKAIEWFKKAGQLGSSAALNNIGYIYGTMGNNKAAISWYEKAANLGDAVAMLNLSNIYRVEYPNINLAQKWLKKAESLTDTFSIRKVADYYFWEDVAYNHIDKAIKLYKKAIHLGDIEAYKELGDVFFGIEDFKNAHDTYRDGANAGNVECMVNLGMMLIYAPNCFEPAQYWLSKAIAYGDKEAVRYLGELYAEYEIYPKALRFYRKAVLNGIHDAAKDLEDIKKLIKRKKPDYKLKVREI